MNREPAFYRVNPFIPLSKNITQILTATRTHFARHTKRTPTDSRPRSSARQTWQRLRPSRKQKRLRKTWRPGSTSWRMLWSANKSGNPTRTPTTCSRLTTPDCKLPEAPGRSPTTRPRICFMTGTASPRRRSRSTGHSRGTKSTYTGSSAKSEKSTGPRSTTRPTGTISASTAAA